MSHQVTIIQVAIHRGDTDYLGDDDSILLSLENEGAGYFVTLKGCMTSQVVIDTAAQADLLCSEIKRLLHQAKSEGES